jgi:calcyphosin
MAFQRFDKDGNGIIDIQDVIGVYDASKHPDVISGKRTAGQILMEFIEGFDVGGEVDGKVTVSEFENYYANLSASIDDDDYFELMIRNAWHISGGEGWCANTSNRRVLVTDSSGNQRVEEIKDDLGLRAEDKSGMMARLRAQGVDVSNIDLTSGLDETSPGNAKGKPPPQVRAQAQSQSRYESQAAQPPPSSQGSKRPEPSLSSSSNRFSSSRAEVRPSSATGHGTNSGSAARAAFPGMVLPNGLSIPPSLPSSPPLC